MNTKLTHRRSQNNLDNSSFVILFAENDDNESYGEHVWELHTDLRIVPESLIDFASKYYDCELEEAVELVDPERIVDSAGAWDDPEFVSELWQQMELGTIEMVAGYRTNDGAVVIDREEVSLSYSVDTE